MDGMISHNDEREQLTAESDKQKEKWDDECVFLSQRMQRNVDCSSSRGVMRMMRGIKSWIISAKQLIDMTQIILLYI